MGGITRVGLVGFAIAAILTGFIGSVVIVGVAPWILKGLLWTLEFGGQGFWGAAFSLTVVIFASALAFALRQHHPDVYGIVEMVFGAITATLALSQYVAQSSADPAATRHASEILPDTAKYAFAAFSGLYVIVRGLDNFGKFAADDSLQRTWFGKSWRYFFVRRKSSGEPRSRVEPSVSSGEWKGGPAP